MTTELFFSHRQSSSYLNPKLTYLTGATTSLQSGPVEEYLYPKLPPKSLWCNLKSLAIKDELEHEIIFTADPPQFSLSTPITQR
jgi:hypothetical protein